ncbi:MAG: hypothetical protein LBM93_03285 [Oscillospiraceae bacterium]|jgi:hypothetical protein|nr:hypothetical protein [Oscillospiraceae bacterium]
MSIFMPKTMKSFQIGASLFYQVVDFVDVDTQAIVTPPTVLRKCTGGTINPQESDANLIKVGPQKFLNNSSETGLEKNSTIEFLL